MRLDARNWAKFRIGDLFNIHIGKHCCKEEIYDNPGDFVVVQAGENNFGCFGKIDKQYCIYKKYTLLDKPCLTVARVGSSGFISYQKHGCVVGKSASILELKEVNKNSDGVMLFLQTILNMSKFKYSYGRGIVHYKYVLEHIKLPQDANGKPDWQFMEDYIKSLHYKPLTTKNKPGNALPLNPSGWKKFKIRDLFNVELSKGDIKLDEVDKGIIPLVSSGETNNGIVGYIDKGGDGKAEIFPQNRITLDMFGNAFYQNRPFYAVSHGRVNILSPKFDLTQNIGLFISAIINQEQYKYSYGRAVYSSVAENMDIKLPITKNNLPDWQFMEDYIKSLKYGGML